MTETADVKADGEGVIFVEVEIVDQEGRVVPDAEVALRATVTGACTLAGFGSANPITEEDYTDGLATTYRGRALAVLRSGYEQGSSKLVVAADGFETAELLH